MSTTRAKAFAERRQRKLKREASGDCFEAAANVLLQLCLFDAAAEHRYRLVHAECRGQGELAGLTIAHAFVLDTEDNIVIDESNGRVLENSRFNKDVYYAIGGISQINNFREYTFVEMRARIVQYKHYGPWDWDSRSGL